MATRETSTELPHYAAQLDLRHEVFDFDNRRVVSELLREVPGADGARIHDLASGDGYFTRLLAEPTSCASVIGLDANEAYLERARHRTPPELGYRVRYERVDLAGDLAHVWPADIGFCADSFRSIDPDQLLRALVETTSAGGHVLLTETDPVHALHTSAPTRAQELLLRALARAGRPDKGLVARARERLESHGFTEVRISTFDTDARAPFDAQTWKWLETWCKDHLQRALPTWTRRRVRWSNAPSTPPAPSTSRARARPGSSASASGSRRAYRADALDRHLPRASRSCSRHAPRHMIGRIT